MIIAIEEKIQAERKQQIKLRNDLRGSKIKSVRQSLRTFGAKHSNNNQQQAAINLKNNQLYILFLASLNRQRENVRARKLLT